MHPPNRTSLTYDEGTRKLRRVISGSELILTPFPLSAFRALNSRNLPYYISIWVTPSPLPVWTSFKYGVAIEKGQRPKKGEGIRKV